MQNVSQYFREARYAGAPTNVRLTFADGTLTKTLICGLSYDSAVNPDTNVTIGSTNCAGLVITCFNNDIGVDLNNKTFTAEIGVYAPSADADANGYEWCALGTFISEKPASTTKERLEIVAYDKMRLFDHDATDFLSGLTFPITAKQLFTQLCDFVGVTASETDFINGSKSFASLSNLGGTTCRDILGYVAELACSFARMSRQDVCELVWFNETQYELDRGKYFAREASEYSVKQIDKLQAKVTADDIGVICGSGENAYIIVDNPLLYGASDADIRPYAQPIYDRLAAMASYVPCSVSAIGDPSIEAGDVITVGCYRYDALISADGKYILDADEKQFMVQHGSAYTGTIRLPIFGVSFDWNGGIRAEYTSTGTESREPLSATNRQHLRDGAAYAEIKVTVEEISTAVYDENGNSIIQQQALQIGLVVNASDSTIKAASIVAAINGDESEIKLSADKLDLNGYATFHALETAGETTINGDNITTGEIKSANYVESGGVATAGTKIDLINGVIKSKQFNINEDGYASYTGSLAAGISISSPNISGGTITSGGTSGASIELANGIITYKYNNSQVGYVQGYISSNTERLIVAGDSDISLQAGGTEILRLSNNETLGVVLRKGISGYQARFNLIGITSDAVSSIGTQAVLEQDGAYYFLARSGSRRDLKQDIRSIPYNDEILKLRPVLYKPKKGKQADYAGFIAEEVDGVCPALATYEEDGKILGVQYDRVCAYLVAEAQKAKRERDELAARLNALEGIAL